MKIDRWQHVQDLYFRALEMPEVHRTPFLETACQDDPRMRQEVESLLQCEDKIGQFLEPMPMEVLEEMVDTDLTTGDAEDSDDIIGLTIADRYVVTQRIGSGGMGDVYRADHRLLGTPVAIKRLAPKFRDRTDYRQRFLEEARRALALDHENIAKVRDVVEEADEVFVIMEFIDGETLRVYRDTPPGIEEFLNIALQCTSALSAAHEQRIAHLDIKPANIMLTASRRVKVCDFGVARQLEAPKSVGSSKEPRWTFGGTPAYMAPEVLESNHFNVRADVFSLGVVFYELLSGTHPFWSDDVRITTNRIVKDAAPPLQRRGKKLPARLIRLIERMLSKDPAKRPSSTETLDELRSIQRRQTVMRDLRRAPLELIPLARRKPGATLTVVLAALVMTAAVTYFSPLAMFGRNRVPDRVAVLPCSATGDITPARVDRAHAAAEFIALALKDLTSFPDLKVAPPDYIREQEIDTISEARSIWGANLVIDCKIAFTDKQVTFTHALIRTADDPKDIEVLPKGDAVIAAVDDRAFYEEKITRAVAASLAIQLEPKRSPGTESEEAFTYFQLGLGVLYDYSDPNNIDKAISLLNDAVREDPKYVAAYAALGQAYTYKFDRTNDRTALSDSLLACQRAETVTPNSTDTQVCLGRVYWKMKYFDLAETALKRATTYSPTNDEAMRLLGRVYEDQDRLDLAEEHYIQAIRVRQDWQSYSWLAGFYADARHDYKKAEENYSIALLRSPGGKNARVFYSLGGVRGMAGDYPRAIEALQESDHLLPNQPKTLSNLAMAYWKTGKPDLAISNFEKAAQVVGQDGRHTVLGNLARIYWATGRKDEARKTCELAIEAAEKLLENDRDNPAIHIMLARFYATLGNRQKAEDSINIALHHNTRGRPKNPHYLLIAATAYALLGEKSLALDHIQFAKNNGYGKAEILAEPELNALKDEPRYRMLISTLK
jgi:eukaryotic-like serine/threonine-protein kinase